MSGPWPEDVRCIAVIDIGKTNAKVVLVDGHTGETAAERSASIPSRQDGPYPHIDAARIWDFICDALIELNRARQIEGISVAAHGSGGAFIDGGRGEVGLALPILDYEFPGPDELASEYEQARPPFEETLSPRLPGGLNLGAQIFWQERRFAEEVQAAGPYVTYPQYWTWRLSGVAATEMCSLGAHSDLWSPRRRGWSGLVGRMGWQGLFAPLRSAFDVLGPVGPDLARRLGLGEAVQVVCGIHDSNASLLPHLKAWTPPFTVASTGTWTVLFAIGGSLHGLDPRRDTLANVTAFGDPVPCARFMGGREFAALVGDGSVEPTDAELARVIANHIMAIPAFVPGVGPFPDREGSWTAPPDGLTPGERTAAASLYLALVTAECMKLADAAGPTIVEGPFARNGAYCAALAAISRRDVFPSPSAGGTSLGAASLFGTGRRLVAREAAPVRPLDLAAFADYVDRWRDMAWPRVLGGRAR